MWVWKIYQITILELSCWYKLRMLLMKLSVPKIEPCYSLKISTQYSWKSIQVCSLNLLFIVFKPDFFGETNDKNVAFFIIQLLQENHGKICKHTSTNYGLIGTLNKTFTDFKNWLNCLKLLDERKIKLRLRNVLF